MDKICPKYYAIMLLERLVVGVCLVLLIDIDYDIIVPISIFLVIGIFVIIKKPFNEPYKNRRVIANMSISITINSIYMSYRLTPQ